VGTTFFILSQITAFDRQTADRQTHAQTHSFLVARPRCMQCMQCDRNMFMHTTAEVCGTG